MYNLSSLLPLLTEYDYLTRVRYALLHLVGEPQLARFRWAANKRARVCLGTLKENPITEHRGELEVDAEDDGFNIPNKMLWLALNISFLSSCYVITVMSQEAQAEICCYFPTVRRKKRKIRGIRKSQNIKSTRYPFSAAASRS